MICFIGFHLSQVLTLCLRVDLPRLSLHKNIVRNNDYHKRNCITTITHSLICYYIFYPFDSPQNPLTAKISLLCLGGEGGGGEPKSEMSGSSHKRKTLKFCTNQGKTFPQETMYVCHHARTPANTHVWLLTHMCGSRRTCAVGDVHVCRRTHIAGTRGTTHRPPRAKQVIPISHSYQQEVHAGSANQSFYFDVSFK